MLRVVAVGGGCACGGTLSTGVLRVRFDWQRLHPRQRLERRSVADRCGWRRRPPPLRPGRRLPENSCCFRRRGRRQRLRPDFVCFAGLILVLISGGVEIGPIAARRLFAGRFIGVRLVLVRAIGVRLVFVFRLPLILAVLVGMLLFRFVAALFLSLGDKRVTR